MKNNHIENINIHKFKCFDSFKVDSFRRVNLIGGKNNVGKTALLEACFISINLFYCLRNINHLAFNYILSKELINISSDNKTFMGGRSNISLDKNDNLREFKIDSDKLNLEIFKIFLVIKNNRGRSYFLTQWLREELDSSFIDFFHIKINNQFSSSFNGTKFILEMCNDDDNNYIKHQEVNSIKNIVDNKYYYTIFKKNHPPILNNTNFISFFNDGEIQSMIDDSKLNGKYIQVKLYLKDIFKIENIDVIKNQVMLFQNNSYRNLSEFGDGVRHFLNIVLVLLSNKDTTVFLDEIDNGIHHSLFDKLWEIILTISKDQNIQVFATTHSQECIESYARVAKKLDDKEITFLELFNHKDKIESMLLNSSMLNLQLDQNHEVRG